jgi:mannose-6-phosphate isomerase-like protein (cupin superfamily)
VRLVYEDQGEPFVMEEGDLVLQPPGIRHRVIESSRGLEVVEITCPAVHETFADHEMSLPNGAIDRARKFGNQTFLRHVANDCPWTSWEGGEAQKTGMREATGALADVFVVRPGKSAEIAFPPHDGELMFGFILEGTSRLKCRGAHDLGPADAFVIPSGETWALADLSADFRLLQVSTAHMKSQPLE